MGQISGGRLYKNRNEELNDIRQSIQVKRYWIVYLLNLRGIAVPDNRVCDTFDVENQKLQKQINKLLQEQSRLKHQYETAEEITDGCGIHSPDFVTVHSDNYFILSIKILEKIIILLTEDQIEVNKALKIINECVTPE